jgi:hypothetical protein
MIRILGRFVFAAIFLFHVVAYLDETGRATLAIILFYLALALSGGQQSCQRKS